MKTHTRLAISGVMLIITPILILAACIAQQLSEMNPPTIGQLKLQWAFIAFYAMAAGIVMLIFARGFKKRELKNATNQKRYEENN
jgi:hypothetical protein